MPTPALVSERAVSPGGSGYVSQLLLTSEGRVKQKIERLDRDVGATLVCCGE